MKEGQRVTYKKDKNLGVGVIEQKINTTYSRGSWFAPPILLVQFQREKVKGYIDDFELYQEKQELIDLDSFNRAWDEAMRPAGKLTKTFDELSDGDPELKLLSFLISTITVQTLKEELFKDVLNDGD